MGPAAILDIGSSKIVCLCGSSVPRGGIAVHGFAVSQYTGFHNGEFDDPADLKATLIRTVQRTEQEARTRIRELAISVPGAFCKTVLTDANVEVDSRGGKVTAEHIDELISQSLKKADCPGYVLMHSTPICFEVDGRISAEAPEGARADDLAATVSHMYVEEAFVKQIEEILDTIHVEISMCVSAVLCEALLVIPEHERIRPAVLIDVGHTCTDIAVIENAALTSLATIDVGGMHLTSDLSFGLDVPYESAEQVKRRFTFGQPPLSDTEIVRLPDGTKRVKHAVVEMILEARAGELAGLIQKGLTDFGIQPEAAPATYLSGGGFAMMRGGCEFLRKSLQLNVKRDMPMFTDENNKPNMMSAYGALEFVIRAMNAALQEEMEQPIQQAATEAVGSVLDRIKDLFTK